MWRTSGLIEVVKTFHVLVWVHIQGGGSVVVEGGRGLETGMQVVGRQRMELASSQTVTDEVRGQRASWEPEDRDTRIDCCELRYVKISAV
jgi:hypothetical protein